MCNTTWASWAWMNTVSEIYFSHWCLLQMWRSGEVRHHHHRRGVWRPLPQHTQVSRGPLRLRAQDLNHHQEASAGLVPPGQQWRHLGVQDSWSSRGIRTRVLKFGVLWASDPREHHCAGDKDTNHNPTWDNSGEHNNSEAHNNKLHTINNRVRAVDEWCQWR